MTDVPVFHDFMNPVLMALRKLGRPASIAELEAAAVAEMRASGKLSEKAASVLHHPEKNDGRTEAGYRIAWARTYLKKAGYITNPTHGTWTLTDLGRRTESIDGYAVSREVAKKDPVTAANNPFVGEDLDLHPVIAERLGGGYKELAPKLPNQDELDAWYGAFRKRFGPTVLAGLDGEELLLRMHERKTKESLVYWLEFKDDEEMPARFGSISGGSALKFGIYQNAETGRWMTGHPLTQKALSVADAVALVRQQRDELVAGARVLDGHAKDPERVDYATLERELVAAAPKLHDTAWGHKYFSLLHPELLDDFHSPDWQRHHLLRLLRRPSDGRYESAAGFCRLARQLGWPTNNLTSLLKHVHGSPSRYWRLDVGSGGGLWDVMRSEGVCALDVRGVPDLSSISGGSSGRQALREALQRAGVAADERLVRELFWFRTTMSPRDRIVACRGSQVLAVGEVQGEYSFSDIRIRAHKRPVRWFDGAGLTLGGEDGDAGRLSQLSKSIEDLLHVEERLLELPRVIRETVVPPVPSTEPPPAPALAGVLAHVKLALERKRQAILYGPPGTGKTYWATLAANELAARSWFKKSWDALDNGQRSTLAKSAVATCCFHPAYGYEDFIEGYRPVQADGGALAFELRSGIFKKLASAAAADKDHNYYLVVDEINRGDVPRIFGELLLVLERDKRGRPVRLPVSGEELVVPDNVYVIGTMNTADRSVALLDAALRRRFSFVELMPDTSVLKGTVVGGIPLAPWLDELNQRVLRHAGRDARNLQVGHSYLLDGRAPISTLQRFAEVLQDDIIPLVQEYCYEDFSALEHIFGTGLISSKTQRINEGLFVPERHAELVQALLSSFNIITATPEAVAETGAEAADDGEGGGEDEAEEADA